MVKKTAFLFVLCAFSAYSAVNFPYPQEKSYGYGTINATSANASANLKTKFTNFLRDFYEEGTCKNNASCARIKFDDKSYTVSEGIGYGMLMMVYFSDAATSYQNHLDKLWVYYNNWPNVNNLMNWKIQGFSNVDQQNAATDAEFDVAIALAMAYYQFGGQKYLDDAKALIKKIREKEMETDGLHKPGDNWNSKRNPSYVSPAAFEVFKEIEDAAFWTKALSRNYTLLKSNQNQSTGLPSDWCNDNGSVNGTSEFGYDASRAPWRWAWANAWYGHEDAKTLLGKLAPWVNGKTPASINGPLNVSSGNSNGNCCNNSTFLGPLTNALSYSSSYQNSMNSFWDALIAKSNEQYFSAAMQLITGLLASGNMPNLKALSEIPSSSSVQPSSSSQSSSSVNSSSSEANSSSSDNDTPILTLPKIAFLNSAITFKNGINLAVKNNAVVEIFGLKGNSMRKFSFANGVYAVSFSDLPKGLYIVKVSFGSEKRILRVPVN